MNIKKVPLCLVPDDAAIVIAIAPIELAARTLDALAQDLGTLMGLFVDIRGRHLTLVEIQEAIDLLNETVEQCAKAQIKHLITEESKKQAANAKSTTEEFLGRMMKGKEGA